MVTIDGVTSVAPAVTFTLTTLSANAALSTRKVRCCDTDHVMGVVAVVPMVGSSSSAYGEATGCGDAASSSTVRVPRCSVPVLSPEIRAAETVVLLLVPTLEMSDRAPLCVRRIALK